MFFDSLPPFYLLPMSLPFLFSVFLLEKSASGEVRQKKNT